MAKAHASGYGYTGGHYNSSTNNSTKSTNNSSKGGVGTKDTNTKNDLKDCSRLGITSTQMLCPPNKECPTGASRITPKDSGWNLCEYNDSKFPGLSEKVDSFNSLNRVFPDNWSNDIKDSNTLISARGSGISAGDDYTSYTSKGYPTGVSFSGKHSFGSDGSNVYVKCEECGTKHEIVNLKISQQTFEQDFDRVDISCGIMNYTGKFINGETIQQLATLINVRGTMQPGWGANVFANITELHLANNNLSDLDLLPLFKSIYYQKINLNILDLSFNKLSTNIVAELLDSISNKEGKQPHHIKILKLNNNQLDDKAAEYFSWHLSSGTLPH